MRNKINLISTAAMIAVAPRAFANDGTKPRVEPQLTAVHTGLEMPVRSSKRGSVSIYPFATLTVKGAAFGVKNKDAASLSSVVSNANRKAIQPKRDDQGNIVFKMTEIKDAAGTVVGTTPTTEPETVVTAKFFAVDVDADMTKKIKGTPLEGSKAIVFREL